MFGACHDLFGKRGSGDGKELGGSILWQKRCMIDFAMGAGQLSKQEPHISLEG